MDRKLDIRYNPADVLPSISVLTKPLIEGREARFSAWKGDAGAPFGVNYAYNVSSIDQSKWAGILERHSNALKDAAASGVPNLQGDPTEGINVIFDCSYEGPALTAPAMKALDEAVLRCGNIRSAVILTQNEQFVVDLKALNLGNVVGVVVHSFSHMVANGFVKLRSRAWRLNSYLKSIEPGWTKHGRKYTCLINRARQHRVIMFGWLREKGLLERGYVSCHGAEFLKTAERTSQTVEEARKAFPAFATEVESFAEAIPQLPFKNFEERKDINYITSFNYDPYIDAPIALVPETEMTNGSIRRYTEKSLKPILSGQIFIVFGNPGTLALLKEFGFRAPWLNAEYDSIQDRTLRLNACIREFENYLAMSDRQIEELRRAAWDDVIGNVETFIDLVSGRLDRSLSELYGVLS